MEDEPSSPRFPRSVGADCDESPTRLRAPRPNLFLIGSMKSATTYLCELLAEHPSVFISSQKEPCHFADERVLRRVWPYIWRLGYRRSEASYLSLFAEAGDATVIAEASTPYSQVPLFAGVAERILAFNPNSRFIYVMRDPIERTISHYWHKVRWWGERRPLLTAIRSDRHYTDVSHYARQLKVYLNHVPRERIYVLTYESLVAQPLEELRRVYAWLGIDSDFQPRIVGTPVNVTPEVMNQVRGLGVLQQLKQSGVYHRIAPFVPATVRKWGTKRAVRPVKPADVPTNEVTSFLRPRQQRETEELSALLNRSFPEWKTLFGR